MAIQKGFRMELDELLRSSAYVLGRGGKGIVYKVVVDNGTTPVAVRRLGGGAAAPERYREFAAEAGAIGRVRHPNVVRLRTFVSMVRDNFRTSLLFKEFKNTTLGVMIFGLRLLFKNPNIVS